MRIACCAPHANASRSTDSAAGGPTVTTVTSPPMCRRLRERELQRRLVGGAHAREAGVVGLTGMGDPLQAGDDHVRRKTTPWPPSG